MTPEPTVYLEKPAFRIAKITQQDELEDAVIIEAVLEGEANIRVTGRSMLEAVAKLASEAFAEGARCEAYEWSEQVGRPDPTGLAEQLRRLEQQHLMPVDP